MTQYKVIQFRSIKYGLSMGCVTVGEKRDFIHMEAKERCGNRKVGQQVKHHC